MLEESDTLPPQDDAVCIPQHPQGGGNVYPRLVMSREGVLKGVTFHGEKMLSAR
jgi:hypothetical protein